MSKATLGPFLSDKPLGMQVYKGSEAGGVIKHVVKGSQAEVLGVGENRICNQINLIGVSSVVPYYYQ